MNLGINFFKKLDNICKEANVKPEDVLLIMTLESGLNPSAVNKDGGASGLVQFMPFILKKYKYDASKYDNKSFNQLSGEEQLDTIALHLKNLSRGKAIKSAAQLYIGNFFPVALYTSGVQSMNPNAPIVEKNPTRQKYKSVSIEFERKAYASNSGLDYDNDGIITYGDIDKKMKNAANSKIYKDAVNMLYQSRISNIEQPQENDNKHFLSDDMLINKINEYLKSANSNIQYFTINGFNLEDKAEYGRIFSIALKEELGIDSFILNENNNLQIKIASNIDLSDFIDEFDKQSIFNVYLKSSKNLNYKIATPEFQSTQFRKQLLKRI